MAAMTVAQAAERLGISERRVRVLAARGDLGAQRFGRDWMLDAAAVARYVPKPAGRPPRRRTPPR